MDISKQSSVEKLRFEIPGTKSIEFLTVNLILAGIQGKDLFFLFCQIVVKSASCTNYRSNRFFFFSLIFKV